MGIKDDSPEKLASGIGHSAEPMSLADQLAQVVSPIETLAQKLEALGSPPCSLAEQLRWADSPLAALERQMDRLRGGSILPDTVAGLFDSFGEHNRGLLDASRPVGLEAFDLAHRSPFSGSEALRSIADPLPDALNGFPRQFSPWHVTGLDNALAAALGTAPSSLVPSLVSTFPESIFRLPGTSEVETLSQRSFTAAETFSFNRAEPVPLSALAQMEALKTPWLGVGRESASVVAFSGLLSIGQGLSRRPPFDGGLAADLRSGLGDWRDEASETEDLTEVPARLELYGRRGFDPSLTRFSPAAFEGIVGIAGFLDSDDAAEFEADAGSAERIATQAFVLVRRLEIALREFIARVLEARFGPRWAKQRLPSNMLDSWTAKQATAVRDGKPAGALIDYADFTDYKSIIERNDNWVDVFADVFGRKENVREALQRLYPVRVAVMHSRRITLDDYLLLLVEARRLLRVMRTGGDSLPTA